MHVTDLLREETVTFFSRSLQAPRYTLRQETLALIKHSLLSGEVLPGRVLSANAIAAELGLSNSPVREALMDLEAQGLLEVVRNRGFRVRSHSVEDRKEIHEMRLIVEVAAMERLSERGLDVEEEAEARRLCAETLAPEEGNREDTVAYLDADQDMHLYLTALLGNQRLTETVRSLRDQTRVGGALVHLPAEKMRHYSTEHADLIDALVARDRARASELMHNHLELVHGDAID